MSALLPDWMEGKNPTKKKKEENVQKIVERWRQMTGGSLSSLPLFSTPMSASLVDFFISPPPPSHFP